MQRKWPKELFKKLFFCLFIFLIILQSLGGNIPALAQKLESAIEVLPPTPAPVTNDEAAVNPTPSDTPTSVTPTPVVSPTDTPSPTSTPVFEISPSAQQIYIQENENGSTLSAAAIPTQSDQGIKKIALDNLSETSATLTAETSLVDNSSLAVQVLSWNTIGLDSNNPVTDGPHQFVVHGRISNPTAQPATNVSATFALGTGNASPYVSIVGPSTQNIGTLSAGGSADVFFQVLITPPLSPNSPSNPVFNTSRNYILTASSNENPNNIVSGVLTIKGLNSQNRNSIQSITVSPSPINLGDTFTVTVLSHTTGGGNFNDISTPMSYNPSIALLLNSKTTYANPPHSENDFYTQNVSGNITSVFTFKAIATGASNFFWLIYDRSGNSYHYNSDFGSAIIIKVEPRLGIAKTPEDQTVNAGETANFSITISNTGTGVGTVSSIIDTLPVGFNYINNSASGVTASNPAISSQNLTWNGPWSVNPGSSITLTYKAKASSQSGTYTNSVIAKDNKDNTIGPAESQIIIPAKSAITIIKDAKPDSLTSFAFTTTGTGLSNFNLTDDSAHSNNTKTFSNLSAGTYTISEVDSPGWNLSSIICDRGNGMAPIAGNLNNRTVTLNVNPGETIVCTFTNTKLTTLKVIKSVINNDGGQALASDFTMKVTAANPSSSSFKGSESGTVITLDAGNYSVSEEEISGYAKSLSSDCLGTIVLGQTKTCTITNDDIAPSLNLVKIVTNDNKGNAVPADWTLSAAGSSKSFTDFGDSSIFHTVLANTVYTLTESGPRGYSPNSWSCDHNVTVQNGNQIILGLNKNVTCVIANDDISPKLTVTKIVINDNNGKKTLSDFPLFVGLENVVSGVQNEFDSGNYIVSETGDSGYTQTISGDCYTNGNITLHSGDVKSCTITNNDKPAHLTVIKHVINDNGGTKSAGDFTLNVNAVNPSPSSFAGSESGTVITLNAGSYSVSEEEHVGYDESIGTGCSGTIANGESKTCTITNNDIAPTITLIKDVINDNGGTAKPDDFNLTIGGIPTLSGVTIPVNANIPIALNETLLNGYSFVSITGDDKCPKELGGTVILDEGENIACTVHNNDKSANLIVIKHVINDNGGEASASDFTMKVTAASPSSSSFAGSESGTIITLDAGNYSVDEEEISGYAKSLGSDCSGTISLGQSKTCTITNNDIAPSLTLVKEVVNDDGGTATANEWILTAAGPSGFSGAGPIVRSGASFDAGVYDLFESGPQGYSAQGWVCEGGTQNSSTVTLGLSQNATCTITNNDIAPTLKLVKEVINDNGGTNTPHDWILTAEGPSGFSDSGNSQNSHIVKAGAVYTLSESAVDGYESGTWSCTEGILNNNQLTLGLFQNAVCTITNNDMPASLTIIKKVINDNGGNASAPSFTILVSGSDVSESLFAGNETGTAVTLSAGSYSISEVFAPGYLVSFSEDCIGTIGLSEHKTCIVTNDDEPPHIILNKFVVNDHGGTAKPDDFNLTIGGIPTLSGVTIPVNANTPIALNETLLSGYSFVSITGDDKCPKELGEATILDEGENITCTITNDDEVQPGHIIIVKNAVNNNALDFTFHNNFGNGNPPVFLLDDDSNAALPDTRSFEVLPGTFSVSEDAVSGWQQESQTCSDGSPVNAIAVSPGEIVTCTFVNEQLAKIILVKNTVGGNGIFDFTMTGSGLASSAQLATLNNSVSQTFNDLDQDNTYSISETVPIGWELTSSECTGTNTPESITPNPGETITCTFTNTKLNQPLTPVLTISKSNSAEGIDISPGGNVLYTITITATQSAVTNVTVTDLLPLGIKYRLGSWSANSSVRGNLKTLGIVSEPTYHSPGTWKLGDMQIGETATLTLIADIDNGQNPGVYKDITLAYGTSFSEEVVLAIANPQGFIDTNFVGTDVSVVKNQQSGISTSVVKKEVLKEVLGASATALPETGANASWTILAAVIFFTGLSFISLGLIMRKHYV